VPTGSRGLAFYWWHFMGTNIREQGDSTYAATGRDNQLVDSPNGEMDIHIYPLSSPVE
jgi:hypothetical protein